MNPQKENISPEEKLLRLIKGQKKQDVETEEKPAAISSTTSVTTSTSSGLRLRLRYVFLPLIQKYFSFLYLRKIVFGALFVSSIYLIVSLIYPFVGLKKIQLPKVKSEKITETKIEPIVEIKPYEFYQQGIANKQIFSGSATQETGKLVSGINVDLMKDINLVGIVSGESPQAVIEDKKTNKTYYVTKGQFMGEFQVEDIQEGKIILNYKGQRFELYL